jgi:hypothetical protein
MATLIELEKLFVAEVQAGGAEGALAAAGLVNKQVTKTKIITKDTFFNFLII